MARSPKQQQQQQQPTSSVPLASTVATEPRRTLLTLAAVAMMTPVMLACLVPFTPQLYFDVDPRSAVGMSPATSIGPAGAAWWHVLSVVIAGVAVAVSVACGGRVQRAAVVVAGLGVLACAVQMSRGYENMIQCGPWLAAAAGGVAAAHLAAHATARRWMIGLFIAALVPLSLDAIWFVFVEHPMTVRLYEADAESYLQGRGWQADTAVADLFERRLRSPDAIGPFALANVFGTVLLGLLFIAAGWLGSMAGGQAGRRRDLAWGAAVVALGATAVWLTHSRGAIAAGLVGVGVLVLARLAWDRRWGAAACRGAAVALLVAAVAAVLIRGAAGPPDSHEGERSLLFRHHYWTAAGRIMLDREAGSPLARAVVGVGPTEFSKAYLRHKVPINPEEVTAAHNVFVDYAVMLGLGGVAWSALLLMWLVSAAPARVEPTSEALANGNGDRAPPTPRQALVPLIGLTLVVFGIDYARVLLPQIVIEDALLWTVSVAGFIAVSLAVVTRRGVDGRWCAAGLFAAAAAVLLHSQIEMGFYQASSSIGLWAVLGLAGGSGVARRGEGDGAEPDPGGLRWRWPAGAALAVTLAVAVAMIAGYAVPVTRHQERLARAAAALQAEDPLGALDHLDRALSATPTDPAAARWQATIRVEGATALARADRRDAAAQLLETALRRLERARVPGPLLPRLRSEVERHAADLLDQPQRLERAIQWRRMAVAASPYNVEDRIDLARMLLEAGRPDEAREALREALRVSDGYYLDPEKQVRPAREAELRRRFGLPESTRAPTAAPDADEPPRPED